MARKKYERDEITFPCPTEKEAAICENCPYPDDSKCKPNGCDYFKAEKKRIKENLKGSEKKK